MMMMMTMMMMEVEGNSGGDASGVDGSDAFMDVCTRELTELYTLNIYSFSNVDRTSVTLFEQERNN